MRPARSALAVLALSLASGCTGGDGIDRLWITDVEVTGENDFGALEVEVHLFDAVDHTFLGCAGQGDGLEDVDESDVHYTVSALLRRATDGGELTPFDITGRSIEVQVIEDDVDPCPLPPGPDDDVIGIATGLDLFTGRPASFDDVVDLRVVVE